MYHTTNIFPQARPYFLLHEPCARGRNGLARGTVLRMKLFSVYNYFITFCGRVFQTEQPIRTSSDRMWIDYLHTKPTCIPRGQARTPMYNPCMNKIIQVQNGKLCTSKCTFTNKSFLKLKQRLQITNIRILRFGSAILF